MSEANRTFSLCCLPAPTRCVLAVFLIVISCGYFSGLVQLHFQHASPGNLLPDSADVVRVYHGEPKSEPKSKLQQLLEADESLPFNGTGTMRPAFTTKSERRWKENLAKLSPEEQKKLLAEREGERQALLDWLRQGAPKEAYDKDELKLSKPLVITEDYIVGDKDAEGRATQVRITSIITDRCVRCHQESGADKDAEKYPLDEWQHLEKYLKVEEGPGPMELAKLAQTTHVHLIGFTMMYGLTGLIFSLTQWPTWIRVVLAPWPMFWQAVDIALWWLARLDPLAAQAILVTGALVAGGFGLQVLGSLLDLSGLSFPRR
ncbi:MAG: DUF1682 domain-containing protein [Gemmatales bacterium]|nr:DUF1682 domain-containing protein [Gemmatales bacterium]MDW8387738.1 hypothetical protein [Gemmatales bacterium]